MATAPKKRLPRTTAADWARTFLAQSIIGFLLAVVWTALGLQ
jgi:hypothetical protein